MKGNHMKKSTTLLLVGGGAVALYLYSKSQAAATTAQQQAGQQAANQGYASSASNFLSSLFGTGTRGGSNRGYGISQAGNPIAAGYGGRSYSTPIVPSGPAGGTGGYFNQAGGYVYTSPHGGQYAPGSYYSPQ
jgi:hypothetical protein